MMPKRVQSAGAELRRRPRIREAVIQGFLFLSAVASILITVGIVFELGKEALLFFSKQQWEETNKTLSSAVLAGDTLLLVDASGTAIGTGEIIRIRDEQLQVLDVEPEQIVVERGVGGTVAKAHPAEASIYTESRVTLGEFFAKTEWNPQIGQFGIWALVNATLITSVIALIVALPLGLGVAIYLSEFASRRVRSLIKPVLEVLAGIPTVVYGFFALTFMTPLLRGIFGSDVVSIYNTASAGIVIGLLILPMVSSMSEDALNAVPDELRFAAFGLGATRLETAIKVVLPAAISGIAASFIVATSRAIGETMIVAIAAGAGANFTFNPFEAAETMTGHIVRISGGDLSYDSIDYNSIFAIGLMLFLMTLSLNIISQQVVRRFREEYS